MKTSFLSSIFLVAIPAVAQAYTVYPGCAVPASKASHHTFYIDPVHGSQSGDGSAAKPWHTLAEVLDTSKKLLSTTGHNGKTFKTGDTSLSAVNPSAPIKPGDVLMLKSGDHGAVKLLNSYNSDFITIMAAPGQKPLLDSLSVVSSGKWIFQGLTFRGVNPDLTSNAKNLTTNLASIGRGDWIGTTSDVILDSNDFATVDDTSAWTASDWNNQPYYYLLLLDAGANCTAATSNKFSNGLDALALGASKSIAQGNAITRMRYDGIDFYGSDQVIRSNSITDGVNQFADNILHPDGIQGWSLSKAGATVLNKNVIIDGNTVLKNGDGTVTQMQGISIFDGLWDGVQITNNFVVSNVYNGISIYGGQNVSIVNNTVLGSDPAYSTWIDANKSKAGVAGQNIIIRNNITSNLNIGYPGVIYDHNLIVSGAYIRDAANKVTVTKTGSVGTNKISSTLLSGFNSFNASASTYDVRLRPNSVAIAAGSSEGAPTFDIVNKRRSIPIDNGAYQH